MEVTKYKSFTTYEISILFSKDFETFTFISHMRIPKTFTFETHKMFWNMTWLNFLKPTHQNFKVFHIWETQNVLKHGWAKHYEANMPKLQSFSHLKHGLVKVSETLQNLKLVFQALESFEVVWNMQNLKKKIKVKHICKRCWNSCETFWNMKICNFCNFWYNI